MYSLVITVAMATQLTSNAAVTTEHFASKELCEAAAAQLVEYSKKTINGNVVLGYRGICLETGL